VEVRGCVVETFGDEPDPWQWQPKRTGWLNKKPRLILVVGSINTEQCMGQHSAKSENQWGKRE